jgi:opacity protein-like surface antigen
MRKLLLAAAFLAAGCLTAAAAGDVGGTYEVKGTNLDGSKYSGTAEITVTSKNTCRIEWKTGGSSSSGICMRNGIALAAGYTLNGAVGLVIYEIKDDGTLDGLWTIADTDGVGTELLIPQ